jgi:hypothetical protein
MSVGSVPHTDPRIAVELVIETTPEIPAWPQLPRRSFLENMYVQFSEGLPGLVVDPEKERVFVRDEVPPDELVSLLERLDFGRTSAFALAPEYAASLPVLAEILPGLSPPFVKGQITGPVSMGLTIPREDRRALLYDDTLRDAVTRLLTMKALWQQELLSQLAPGALPLIMIDEPYLTQLGSAYVSIPDELWLPLLEEVLGPLDCLAGIHVCGGTDWARVTELPLDLLNFDAADHMGALLADREAVVAFILEGGLLAWGVVPNDERAWKLSGEDVGRHVLEGAEALTAGSSVSVQELPGAHLLPLPVAPAVCPWTSPSNVCVSRQRLQPGCGNGREL